ncbi:phenylalanine 4-monooxygenase [Streptomyces sp. B1866]|uniref:phenylalanine 4-monooxygenase n=1 Tax=Streptomyces sp. B1866 TaxID=3075431 RepID=UPI002890DCC5|nr:phenylalanine 4-monooxygenase [Streptomyces sp. B1866]MDT3399602.1 phenylalanine 4-monooxygenase [Streptomyces sp. B1866]
MALGPSVPAPRAAPSELAPSTPDVPGAPDEPDASGGPSGPGGSEGPPGPGAAAGSAYARRREHIQRVSRTYRPGGPLPHVDYTPAEHATWAAVHRALDALHEDRACAEYREAARSLDLPRTRVPQLAEVSERLTRLTGFRLEPAEGTVSGERFYRALAEGCFLSTQYLRDPASPFYSPEPDLIHELVGHAVSLASPVLADLYRRAGQAAGRARDAAEAAEFDRVFWFTLEAGAVREGGRVRAYGGALLSSADELRALDAAAVRDFSVAAVTAQDFDITRRQPVLFAAGSLAQAAEALRGYLAGFGTRRS